MFLTQKQISSFVFVLFFALEVLVVAELEDLVAIVFPVLNQGLVESILSRLSLVQDFLDLLGIDVDICHVSTLPSSTHHF